MPKKIVALLLSVLMMFLCLTACAQKNDDQKDESESSEISSSEEVSQTTEGEPATDNDKEPGKVTENDLRELEKMLGIMEPSEAFDVRGMSTQEILDGNFIVNTYVASVGLYYYFFDEDWKQNVHEGDEYSDPKGQMFSYSELNADNVDWILKNVYDIEPDRTLSSEATYYEGDKFYHEHYLGGGPGVRYAVRECKELPDGNYRIIADCYIVLNDYENEQPYNGTVRLIAQLRNDENFGNYWCIISFERAPFD